MVFYTLKDLYQDEPVDLVVLVVEVVGKMQED